MQVMLSLHLSAINHVVPIIVRDRSFRADAFTRVALDADFGIDQVLPDDCIHELLYVGRSHFSICAFAPVRPNDSSMMACKRLTTSSDGVL